MPVPIDKLGVNAIVPKTDVTSSGPSKGSEFQNSLRTGAEPKPPDLPPLQQVSSVDAKQMQHDLRIRIDRTGNTDPKALFGGDITAARTQLDAVKGRVEAAKTTPGSEGIRDRLSAIEAQFESVTGKTNAIPDTNNLRDLLALQTEMYTMSQNIEVLSKVVDAASSGVKSTLQMQV